MPVCVNGEPIADEVVEAEMARIRQHVGQGVPADALQKEARNRCIELELVRQASEAAGHEVSDAEVEAERDRFLSHVGGAEALTARSRYEGPEDPALLEDIRTELMRRKTLAAGREEVAPPTEEEARTFYDEHREEYIEPAQIHAHHLVRRPTGPDDRETFQTLVEARQAIRNGEPFAGVADRTSECSNEPGGDLGWISKGQMVEPFEIVAFSMEPGEVSPVFQTQFGYHIATVSERREAQERSFDEVRDNVLARLHREREHAADRAYVRTLLDAAEITGLEAPDAEEPSAKDGKQKRKGKGGRKGKGRKG
jgi:parvulin-like peptidyl-prolyl isomerase